MSGILLVFATIHEAKPFIEISHAKQSNKKPLFYISSDEYTTILITGIGIFNATIHLTEFLTSRPKPTLIANIGLAGSVSLVQGNWYAASAVSYNESKSIYTDIISRTLNYAHLHTVNTPATTPKMSLNPLWMYDMEAYGLFLAARHYVKNHQFQAIKFISDNDGEIATVKKSLSYYSVSCKTIWDEVRQIHANIQSIALPQNAQKILLEKIETFCELNKLSFSQKHLLIEHMIYLKNSGYCEVVDSFLNSSYLHITDRDSRFVEIIKDLGFNE